MAHGTADFLPMEAPDSAFAALKRLGKRVDYVIYDGAGHVFERTPVVMDFWKRRLSFLADNLDLQTDVSGAVVFFR